jgi:hypothetical protein
MQPCWKVDAHAGHCPQATVPGTLRRVDFHADKSTFCEYNYGIPCMQLTGLHADPAENKSFNR